MASPNFNQNQSAYCSGHFISTETALLLLLDRICLAADGSRSTLLLSLDLSTQFIIMYYLAGLTTASLSLALPTHVML